MTFKEIIDTSKNNSISELKSLISNILLGVDYGSIFCKNQEFEGLYRARQHNQIDGNSDTYLFTNEKEFWNPASEYIKRLGRCNDIGESLFYCSNEFETAVLEVRPNKGKFISVASFAPILQEGELPTFRIKPNCIQHLKKIDGFKSCISGFDLADRNIDFIAVDNLLDYLFTEVVNEGEEHKYKVTNAITQCMLTSIVNQHGHEFQMNGMIYPSIVNGKNSVNILIKPVDAECNFFIKTIQTFKIIDVTDRSVKIKLVRNGRTVDIKTYPKQKQDIQWTDISKGDSHEIVF